MITFLDIISAVINWSYALVFFVIISTFLPLHSNKVIKVISMVICGFLVLTVVYMNDLTNILGASLGFVFYTFIFHKGRVLEKTLAVFVFYPSVMAINFLTLDLSGQLFFYVSKAEGNPNTWPVEILMLSTVFYLITSIIRLLFWIIAWRSLGKSLKQIVQNLTKKMLLILNFLVLSTSASIFTVLAFSQTNYPIIVYPICVTAVFSSFGSVYLVSYLCNSIQMAYQVKELETQCNFYKDRSEDEKMVQGVYHDLKNHLLVLQSTTGSLEPFQQEIRSLQDKISTYEDYYHTGNEFLDVLMRDKVRLVKEKQIDFQASISFEGGGFIAPLDISTIFGNALDNAIEASEKLEQSMRLINVKASKVREMLVIVIENNCIQPIDNSTKTTKKDKFFHGYGLNNIKNAVGKYQGECIVKCLDLKFTLKIVIPISEGS